MWLTGILSGKGFKSYKVTKSQSHRITGSNGRAIKV
jgi:hypothetical protein